MPVVPFSPAPAQREAAPRKLSEAEEPWVLMAAAQMDQQKRLVEPDPEDSADG